MTDAREPEISPVEGHLMAELREVLDPDPAPAGLIERAEGLVAFMDVDRDLAALLEESSSELAGTRGGAAPGTQLTFETADGAVSVEAVITRDRVAGQLLPGQLLPGQLLSGQVLSGTRSEVTLERLSGDPIVASVDELGRFAFDNPPPGPARLRWPVSTTRSATSDWFLL